MWKKLWNSFKVCFRIEWIWSNPWFWWFCDLFALWPTIHLPLPTTFSALLLAKNLHLFSCYRHHHHLLVATSDFWASPMQRQPHIYLIINDHLWGALQLSAHLGQGRYSNAWQWSIFVDNFTAGSLLQPTLPNGATTKCCELFVGYTAPQADVIIRVCVYVWDACIRVELTFMLSADSCSDSMERISFTSITHWLPQSPQLFSSTPFVSVFFLTLSREPLHYYFKRCPFAAC